MINRKQKMQKKSENCSLSLIQTIHGQLWKVQHCQCPLALYPSNIQFWKIQNYIR